MVNCYRDAFSRNLGWITEGEQETLRGKRVAIAGVGGVGGVHLLTLARLGIGAFNIADKDRFELANFNRQAGAFTDTIGKEKVAVMADMVRRINPEADIRLFPEGVAEKNLDDFLSGVDLFVDGFDAFVLGIRAMTFARCHEMGIAAITAAPLGMGTAYLVFKPGGMTFEEYFRLEGLSRDRQYVHWFLGLAPKGINRRYLIEPSRMDIRGQRGPSIGAACMLCAGVVGIEALKLLLGRGKVYAAPHFHQLDPFAERFVRGRLRGGNRHPLQRIKIALAMKLIGPLAEGARPIGAPAPDTPLMRILDAARWTPSADNSQPWRFSVTDGAVTVHVSGDPNKTLNVRDSEIALLTAGMMLEIMTIAAASEGASLCWRYLPPEDAKCLDHRFGIALGEQNGSAPDPLYPYIILRHTNRRHYRTTPLTDIQKRTLAEALGDTLAVRWMEGPNRRPVARVNMEAFAIRMRSESAYRELATCLDWKHPFPKEKLPVLSLPTTPISRHVMRWAMGSWTRMKLLGMIPGALLPSAIETEWLPALRCGAHFMLVRPNPLPEAMDKRTAAMVAEGRALMRFWLTAARLGLDMQPSFASIVFAQFGPHPERLPPQDQHLAGRCLKLARHLEKIWGTDPLRLVFTGRIGIPRTTAVAYRSLRKPLNELIA